jgi:signal transduction histidine kinase
MKQFLRFKGSVAATMIEHPWLFLLLLGASALIFELLEQYNTGDPVDAHFVRELLFFGALYPLLTVWLMNKLLSVRAERNSIAWQQQRSRQLKQELLQAQDLEGLYQTIVSFPESIAPVMGVILFRPIPGSEVLEIAADRWLVRVDRPPQLRPRITYDFCGLAAHMPDRGLHPFASPHFLADASLHGYCLPLFRGGQVLGLLHLYLPMMKNLTSDQIALLNQTATAMALALGLAAPQNVALLQAAAARHERERIARHLHDTVGQSLAYLQVKLTKFTADNGLADLSSLQQDLGRMRDISHEAYEQVRQTLLTMQADSEQNLTDALVAQARAMTKEGGLEVCFVTDGRPRPLPPLVHRKILFIFREALHNVLRHAQATAVNLSVTWDADALMVTLQDDGAGFYPEIASDNGHFGLLIMAQRAAEIKGDLAVTSAPGRGTYVRLRYCLNGEP